MSKLRSKFKKKAGGLNPRGLSPPVSKGSKFKFKKKKARKKY